MSAPGINPSTAISAAPTRTVLTLFARSVAMNQNATTNIASASSAASTGARSVVGPGHRQTCEQSLEGHRAGEASVAVDDGDQWAALGGHHGGYFEQRGLRRHGGRFGDRARHAVTDRELSRPVPEQVGVDLVDGADERRVVPIRLWNRQAQHLRSW